MIANTRVLSQQLSKQSFDKPKDLVSWMGAIQAQSYEMSKWAVGIRTKSARISDVEEALQKGEILRTHILRPTWHLVAAEDIRWMLALSSKRIKAAIESYGKYLDIPNNLYSKSFHLIEKILEGNKSMTKQEIGEEITRSGITIDTIKMNHLIMQAEAEGIICSGIYQGSKNTYALLEERVAPAKKLEKEEALARLATKYFQSHSPASLQDFTWWSGLSITEARQAIKLIEPNLIADRFASENVYIHESYDKNIKTDNGLYLLPSYDEYLISYKDRTTVLDLQHHSKAFSNNGIFQPVILHQGIIIGNWKKSIKKGGINIEASFFEQDTRIDNDLINKASERYKNFVSR